MGYLGQSPRTTGRLHYRGTLEGDPRAAGKRRAIGVLGHSEGTPEGGPKGSGMIILGGDPMFVEKRQWNDYTRK